MMKIYRVFSAVGQHFVFSDTAVSGRHGYPRNQGAILNGLQLILGESEMLVDRSELLHDEQMNMFDDMHKLSQAGRWTRARKIRQLARGELCKTVHSVKF